MDTPPLGIPWCPLCEPGRDPTREILETRYCSRHELHTEGADDGKTGPGRRHLSGAADADAATCRAMQGLIR